MAQRQSKFSGLVWRQPDGEPVSCIDKIKVLNENLEEIEALCREALEDAVLIGCDERQVREVLERIVREIPPPFKD